MNYEELKNTWMEEEQHAFQGWDFSHLQARWQREPLPWDYESIVLEHLHPTDRLLDMGTGGGEVLLSLRHPYENTAVTEAWPPNIRLCMEKLAPLGIRVCPVQEGAPLQESITAIKDEAANMKELVEQLLFLARGDNNTIQLQLEEVNLSGLCGEVLQETRMIDSTHNFDDRSDEVWVMADRALLKQALRILIDNAIKYTDPGGYITVAAGAENGVAVLSVTDDGIGISPEIVPQIFDRFYRADASRARATGGAGLGLSIAKWIATRHGGHMEVLSRVGIGTKILIALTAPISPSEQPAAPGAPDNPMI